MEAGTIYKSAQPSQQRNNIDLLRAAISGDQAAISRLVEENTGLVWSVVRKFTNRSCETDDLYQIGCMGLLKAIKKFDLSYEVKFSTYAVPMIMGEIKRFLRDDGPIKVSRSIKELATKARTASDIIQKRTGETPTMSTLASELGVDIEDIVFALDATQTPESLYAGEDADEGTSIISRAQAKVETESDIVDKLALQDALRALPARERQIVIFRYFQGKTQSQVAELLGVSQVQISRLEKKVLANMREKVL